jgi:hypothetical protein
MRQVSRGQDGFASRRLASHEDLQPGVPRQGRRRRPHPKAIGRNDDELCGAQLGVSRHLLDEAPGANHYRTESRLLTGRAT